MKQSTQDKYSEALLSLSSDLDTSNVDWFALTEEQQDEYLAEWILDGYENEEPKSHFALALSALQKIYPRARFKTSWKVLDVWSSHLPVRQAPAAPPELIGAMIAAAVALGRAQLGLLICLCFAGVLRVREALWLKVSDIFIDLQAVTLCLGVTKRGLEQKVVLRNPSVINFINGYMARFPETLKKEYVFDLTYATALRWVKKLADLLGAASLHLTTHTFRRSGASELSRLGMSLADILLYGRWQSERSAREYIRRGEVAVIRARGIVAPADLHRLHQWQSISERAWSVFDVLHAGRSSASLERVTRDRFIALEGLVFAGFAQPGDHRRR